LAEKYTACASRQNTPRLSGWFDFQLSTFITFESFRMSLGSRRDRWIRTEFVSWVEIRRESAPWYSMYLHGYPRYPSLIPGPTNRVLGKQYLPLSLIVRVSWLWDLGLKPPDTRVGGWVE
jgi:hypothetical protein